VLRFLLVVLLFAALVYALMWTIERRRTLGGGGGGRPALRPKRRPRGPAPRQVAPDDDEDFLRWLERKQRKDRPGGDPPS
jgi:hypothetical protein